MSEVKFDFNVASDVDYENLIADIGFDGKLVALLTQEDGFDNLRISIVPPTTADCWNFRLDEFQDVIEKAKKRLWELRRESTED